MKKNKTTHMMAGILIVCFVGLFLLLTGRFLYIQVTGVVDNVSLKDWAKEKRTASYSIEAERGKIYDSSGMLLAYDRPTFRLYAIVDKAYSKNLKEPKHVEDPEKTAEMLAPLLNMDKTYIVKQIKDGIEKGRTQVEFGAKGKQLSQKKKEEIEALKLPGINFTEEAIRYYPNGKFASHIIGFAQESEKKTDTGVEQNITGVTGIEKEMNDLLAGKDGYISFERDRFNKKLLDPNEKIKKPHDGDDIYLTIDQKIQTLLEDVMSQVEDKYEPERLTAIVMNPKTGEILAMSNRPSYDPNNPADVKNWYDDAISTPIEPGSTMKIFTWASAIEEGVYNGADLYKSGKYKINKQIRAIPDHNYGKGWGTISYDEGFQRSSNVAAAKLAWEKLGPEKYLEYLKAFDFDKETNIDLPGEVKGKILYNWPLEKATTAFGQGSTITPIQQMKAATAIANNGKMMQPFVLKKIVDANNGTIIEESKPKVVGEPISPETSKQMLNLMESVVNGKYGTGKMYALDDYSVVGKTGTAQIPDPETGGYMSGVENNLYSFLGMAPKDDPQLMMYVSIKQPKLFFEEGYEHGATPTSFIFKNVMQNGLHYMDIKPDKSENNKTQKVKVPDLVGESVTKVKQVLAEKDIHVTVIGSGDTITRANVAVGDDILPGKRVLLLTENPSMPSVIGWSMRDVLQLAQLTELKLETIGNGYVVKQSIQQGKPIKENAYLGVELKPPNKLKLEKNTEEKEAQQSDGDIE
ncbi:penicillin-binding protein [Virgibacillus sp. MG-45]|uniref:penicillin-binding protein n=1 Tax=Virgibacillus sp. MG-45 TaxID=3102791 RepID=UPI002ED9D5A9